MMTLQINGYSAQLPAGIRARNIAGVNGMNVHLLEAGFDAPGRPCALLLHGFPELAYSWRKIMPELARAGFYVLAPDQRGYGSTSGWDDRYDGDLDSFRMLNLVRDQLALLARLEISQVDLLVGHDFGSPVAAWAALIRPDIFRSVVLMSAPFGGPSAQPSGQPSVQPSLQPSVQPYIAADSSIHEALARLKRPRKHYQWYYSTAQANQDMLGCRQGLPAFLRAYYHFKSADHALNQPRPLASWTADELAQLPDYYVMDQALDMAQTVAPFMPDAHLVATNTWLTELELSVYVRSYQHTGFQGGLNWYRCGANGMNGQDFSLFAGRRIEVPAMFIAGSSDWGTYQKPGEFERMQGPVCTQWRGAHLIAGAGHWVQQEQPQAVTQRLLDFAGKL
jgi:pimeloyl-ACP methyl ester carboxylesterase